MDEVGKQAHELILGSIMRKHRQFSNEDIFSDNLLIQQLGETETVFTVKPNRREGREIMSLIFVFNCSNFKQIVELGKMIDV